MIQSGMMLTLLLNVAFCCRFGVTKMSVYCVVINRICLISMQLFQVSFPVCDNSILKFA